MLSQVLLHSFHSLLQLQCRALVLQFGLPAALASLVGRLWLTYLSWWRTSTQGGWGATHRQIIVRRYVPGLSKAQTTPQIRIAAAAAAARAKRNAAATAAAKSAATAATSTSASAFATADADAAVDAAADLSLTQPVVDDGSLRDDADSSLKKKKKKRSRSRDDLDLDGPNEDEDDDAEEEEEEDKRREAALLDEFAPSDNEEMDDHAADRDPATAADADANAAAASAGVIPPSSAAATGGAGGSSRDQIILQAGELSLSLSLALLFLGCQLLREPITMQQLCVWVHLGRVPYFSAKGIPGALYERVARSSKLSSFVQPASVPAPTRLLNLAHRTAATIASAMEAQALSDQAAAGVATEDTNILLQQAKQLRVTHKTRTTRSP